MRCTTIERRKRPGRPRSARRKLALGLACLIIVLAGIEIGLRATGALLLTGRQSSNAEVGSDERVVTILCVGDSWTQGADYGRYPDALVARLNARRSGTRFRQINLGRAGTNSSQTLRRLPAEIARYRPDLLLVLTGNNDHHNLTDSTYWRFRNESLGDLALFAARARAALHSLRVFRLGRTLWQSTTGRRTANEFFEAAHRPTDAPGGTAIDPESHRRQLEYNLTRVIELARRERVPVVLQTYFHFHGYRVNEVVRDVAARHGVPLADHNRMFHTAVPQNRRDALLIEDGHPNAAGYDRMARHLVATLDEHTLLP